MGKIFRSALLFLSLVAPAYCLASEPIKLKSSFNEKEVKWVKEKGNSSVLGSANIKLGNGELKGCATFNVELLPVSSYSTERITKTYGNNTSGKILVSQNPPKFTPDVKEYHELVISTQCDANGKFEFKEVPPGEFYILAFIIWDEEKDGASNKLGGAVMKKMSVKPNQKIEVSL